MRIAITCPIYLTNKKHAEYLDLFTKSIKSRNHDIFFIPVVNHITEELAPYAFKFDQEPDEILIQRGKDPQTVAGAWNVGVEKAAYYKCDYVLVTNTDIVFKHNAIDRLVDFAEAHTEFDMWTSSEYPDLGLIDEADEDENYSEHPHFSCFMVKPSILEKYGLFDENFNPAYCEDADYHARITLGGGKAVIYGGSKFYHFGSRTIKEDQALWEKNTVTFPQCQIYFMKKWGRPVVNDVEDMKRLYFKTPYNDPNLTIKEWK